jgi:hypothetical protein
MDRTKFKVSFTVSIDDDSFISIGDNGDIDDQNFNDLDLEEMIELITETQRIKSLVQPE